MHMLTYCHIENISRGFFWGGGVGDAPHTPERLHHPERYWQLQILIFRKIETLYPRNAYKGQSKRFRQCGIALLW
jgi:hypothetical protein